MHQQVGIAADRRSEVRVGLVGEAEMAHVVRACTPPAAASAASPSAAAAHRDAPLIRSSSSRVVARHAARRRRRGRGRSPCSKSRSASSFSGVGPSCTRYSVGLLVLLQEIRGADVGRQHALLDQAVRVVAHHAARCARSCPGRRRSSASRPVSKSIAPRFCARAAAALEQPRTGSPGAASRRARCWRLGLAACDARRHTSV